MYKIMLYLHIMTQYQYTYIYIYILYYIIYYIYILYNIYIYMYSCMDLHFFFAKSEVSVLTGFLRAYQLIPDQIWTICFGCRTGAG